MKSPSLRAIFFLRLHVYLLLFIALTPSGSSQSAIRLTGRVTATSGAPLSGASVSATNEQTGQVFKAVAGPDGTYSVEMPPGTYSFTFTANGHTGATFHDIAVPHPDGSAPLDAVLPPLPRQNNPNPQPGSLPLPTARSDGSKFPPSDISTYTTGRSFLVSKEEEESGFGLYSYLLLPSPPTNDTEKQRDLAVVRVFVDRMQDVADIEASGRAKGDLNVTYLLVVDHPQASPLPSPEWVLSHYNFARAKVLLFPLARAGHDVLRGPYIVSCLKPLSHLTEAPEPHLWQDMSSVPGTVAASWEVEFETRASRKEFWAPDTRNQALLSLRTFIASSADAATIVDGGAVEFKKKLFELVSWSY